MMQFLIKIDITYGKMVDSDEEENVTREDIFLDANFMAK